MALFKCHSFRCMRAFSRSCGGRVLRIRPYPPPGSRQRVAIIATTVAMRVELVTLELEDSKGEVHSQSDARRARTTMDKSDTEAACEVMTLEDFGRRLQQLRESKHVTQTSLSARVAAIAGYRISRSRISEIENARRDRITERELRVYMLGLRCTHGHLDQMMKALRQCVATPAQASINAVTPTVYSTELDGTEDHPTQEKEKIDNDPIAASEEKEDFEHARGSWTCTDSFDASQFRPFRRRRLPRHINVFGAMALVIAGFMGFNANFLLRQKSDSPPPSTGTTTVLLIPPNTLPKPDDSSNLVKSVTSLDRTVALSHEKWPSATLKISSAPIVEDANSRNTTKPEVKHCCVEDEQPRAVSRGALPNSMQDWHSYTGPWPLEASSDQLMNFRMR